MTTNFPTSLDNSTTLPAESSSTPLSTNHVTAHQNMQDAMEAVQAKVGADSSAVTSSHDYKLGEVTGSDKAVGKTATQTLTNKTLTSPVINVGSDATGDIYYRNAGVLTRLPIGSDNHILKVNGTVPNWEAETTTVNGSTTVAGVFEAGTSSEVTAGTATGGTGAVLVVTPDALAASTPVFNGSGLTNVSKKIDITTTDGSVSATGADTAFYTVSIPSNTLGTNSGLVGKVYFEWTSATTNAKTIKLKYGSTTVATYTATPSGTTSMTITGYIDFMLLANGSTSSQEGSLLVNGVEGNHFFPSTVSNKIAFGSALGTAAENSTTTLNLVLSVTQNSSDSFVMRHGYIMKLH